MPKRSANRTMPAADPTGRRPPAQAQPKRVAGKSPGATNRGGKFSVVGRDPRAGKPSSARNPGRAHR